MVTENCFFFNEPFYFNGVCVCVCVCVRNDTTIDRSENFLHAQTHTHHLV